MKQKIGLIVFALIGAALGVMGYHGKASALTYQDTTNVGFTFNSTISINLSDNALIVSNLMPGSSSDSNLLTIDVSTNSGYGYYLAATVGASTRSSDLVNVENSGYSFASLASNAATLASFPDNRWGYSYSTDGGTTWVSGDAGATSTGYNGLPVDNNDNGATGVKLLNTNSLSGSSSVKFKIAAKAAATQAAGTYTNTVNFYAVANPDPSDAKTIAQATTLQEVSTKSYGGCPNTLTTGQAYTLTDERDGTVYHVARLADGNCWMLDNLALDISNSTVKAALSSSNTNANSTTLNYLKNGGGATSDRFATSGPVAAATFPGEATTVPYIYAANKDVVTNGYGSGDKKTGVYYNFCAASAGGYCYVNDEGVGDTVEDICPKNWRLPTSRTSGGDYNTLYSAYSSNDTNFRNAFSATLAGEVSDQGVGSEGGMGYYWSSSNNEQHGTIMMNGLIVYDNQVIPHEEADRAVGLTIRCMLKD